LRYGEQRAFACVPSARQCWAAVAGVGFGFGVRQGNRRTGGEEVSEIVTLGRAAKERQEEVAEEGEGARKERRGEPRFRLWALKSGFWLGVLGD
jgi:hypothetical protein